VIHPTRIFHVNVNCRDLDRSVAFYRDVIGLRARIRTTPEAPQPGAGFGLELVQWDAWMLEGDAGYPAPLLDLLEWHVPRGTGAPPSGPLDPGFSRLRFTSASGRGVHTDPDGTRVELVGGDRTGLAGIVVNCTDAARTRHHYADVCGLTVVRDDLLQDPATGFAVELVEHPAPDGAPAPRQANDLGIFRMAWITDDIDRDHAALLDAGVQPVSVPAALAMGPGLPAVRALFWRDPDGACLELIQSP